MAAWRFMHSGSACIMIGFRSDHACMNQNSETERIYACGQPASARAWPAASGQLAGWPVASARVLRYQIGIWRARIHGAPCPLHLRAPNTYLVPWIYDLNFDFWGTQSRHDKPPIAAAMVHVLIHRSYIVSIHTYLLR